MLVFWMFQMLFIFFLLSNFISHFNPDCPWCYTPDPVKQGTLILSGIKQSVSHYNHPFPSPSSPRFSSASPQTSWPCVCVCVQLMIISVLVLTAAMPTSLRPLASTARFSAVLTFSCVSWNPAPDKMRSLAGRGTAGPLIKFSPLERG